jgi:hypothetical protein
MTRRVVAFLTAVWLTGILAIPAPAEARQQVPDGRDLSSASMMDGQSVQGIPVVSTTVMGGAKYYFVPRVGWLSESSLKALVALVSFVWPVDKLWPVKDRSANFGLQASSAPPAGSLRWLPALVVDGGVEFSDTTLLFGAGPRIFGQPAGGKWEFFGQVLVGGLHFKGGPGFSGGTDFVLTPGGGVIFAVPNHQLRLTGQLDFPIDFFGGGHATATQVTFGIAVPLGRR